MLLNFINILRMKIYVVLSLMVLSPVIEAAITIDKELPLSNVDGGGTPRNSHYVWTFESDNDGVVGTDDPSGDPVWGYFADGYNIWVAPHPSDDYLKLVSMEDGEASEEHYMHIDINPQTDLHGLGPFTNWDLNSATILAAVSGATQNYAIYSNVDRTEDVLDDLPILFDLSSANTIITAAASTERNSVEESTEGAGWRVGGTNQTSWGQIASYMFVTVLDAPPNDGANGGNTIRPNVVGDTKYLLTWDDFDLNNLPSLSKVGSKTSGELASLTEKLAYTTESFAAWTWSVDKYTKHSEGGRGMRPITITDEYGAFWAGWYTGSVLGMLGNNTLADKKPALAALLANGLDLYHQHYHQTLEGSPPHTSGLWGSGAGQSSGSALPSYFSIALLDGTNPTYAAFKDNMRSIVFENWDATDEYRGPDEMRHNMRGPTGVLVWGNGHERRRIASTDIPYETARRYWGEFEARNNFDGAVQGSTTGGRKTAADPHGYIDGPPGGPGGYMDTTLGPTRLHSALCILMPAFGDVVNTTDPIEYADRATVHGKWTLPDPAQIPSVEDQLSDCNPYGDVGACVDYRTGWGPSLTDWRIPVMGGTGRYASKHGNGGQAASSVTVAGHTWAEIMAQYDGPTYLERAVPIGTAPAPDIYTYPDNGSQYAIIRCGLDGAILHYTLDGEDPTASSQTTLPLVPIEISEGATVKAIAVKSGHVDSPVTTKIEGIWDAYAVGEFVPAVIGRKIRQTAVTPSLLLNK